MKAKQILNIFLYFGVVVILAIVLAQYQAQGIVLGFATLAAYTKTCAKNVGGITAVYVTEIANLDTVTVTSGEISTLTMDAAKTFQEVQADLDSVKHTEEGTGTQSNIFYDHKIEMRFMKPSTALNTLRDALADASACGIATIVTDGNGTSWLVGWNETDGDNRPLYLATDSKDSGAEPNEDNSQAVSIVLEGKSGYLSLPFDSVNNGTISGGTATFITYA